MKKTINKNRIFYFIVGGLALLLIIAIGVKVCFDFIIKEEKPVVKKQELENIEKYGYTLDDLDSYLYKTYFEELKEVLNSEEVDMEKYASVLGKLFITDFYTLETKVTSSDIGGVEFVHPEILDNFKMNAGDTIYNHVKNNVYGDRTQELPKVKSVEVISVEKNKYSYNNVEYDGFKLTLSWEYEKDLGYDKEGVLYLINVNEKLVIVEKSGE